VKQANKRDITIEVDLRLPKLPKFIMGDPLRLRQILLNLFSNAIKFCNDGGCVALIAEYIGLVSLFFLDYLTIYLFLL